MKFWYLDCCSAKSAVFSDVAGSTVFAVESAKYKYAIIPMAITTANYRIFDDNDKIWILYIIIPKDTTIAVSPTVQAALSTVGADVLKKYNNYNI